MRDHQRTRRRRRENQPAERPPMRAIFLRNVHGWGGPAKHWMTSEHFWAEGILTPTRHLVSVELNQHDNPRTYLYAVTERGRTISWRELPGSLEGVINHDDALRSFCAHHA